MTDDIEDIKQELAIAKADLESFKAENPDWKTKEVAMSVVAALNQVIAALTNRLNLVEGKLDYIIPQRSSVVASTDIQAAIDSSLILSIEVQTTVRKKLRMIKYSSSAVAISNKRALTALHGKVPINHPVKIRTINGTCLSGKVEFERFEETMVDIAVILLDEDSSFANFMTWTDRRVHLTQHITVVGLKYSSDGESVGPYAKRLTVDMIEDFGPNSALFQTQYYNFRGCSGTGIVTTTEQNTMKVVGVHVASHDDSTYSNRLNSKKRSFAQFEASVNSTVHGHTAYNLVCEIARVPDLVALLRSS